MHASGTAKRSRSDTQSRISAIIPRPIPTYRSPSNRLTNSAPKPAPSRMPKNCVRQDSNASPTVRFMATIAPMPAKIGRGEARRSARNSASTTASPVLTVRSPICGNRRPTRFASERGRRGTSFRPEKRRRRKIIKVLYHMSCFFTSYLQGKKQSFRPKNTVLA